LILQILFYLCDKGYKQLMKVRIVILWLAILPYWLLAAGYAEVDKLKAEFSAKANRHKLTFVNNVIYQEQLSEDDLDAFLVFAFQNWPEFIYSSPEEMEDFLLGLMELPYPGGVQTLTQTIIDNKDLPVWGQYYFYAWMVQANYHFQTDNFDSLSQLFESLDPQALLVKNDFLMGAYYNLRGFAYFFQSDYFNAILAYSKALDRVQQGYSHNIPVLYLNIANAFIKLKSYTKADYYLNLGLEACSAEDSLLLLSSKSLVNMHAQRLEEAEEISQFLLKEFIRLDRQLEVAKVYANLGNIYLKGGEYTLALASLDSSDHICRQLGVEIGLINNRINRTNVFLEQKKFSKSLVLAKELEMALKETPLKEYEMANFENLFRIYDGMGQMELANAYFRKWKELKEDLMGDNTKLLISEWELAVEREQNALKLAEQEIVINQQIAQRKMIYLLVAFLLVIILFSFLLYRRQQRWILEKRRREQEKLEHALQMNYKEKMAETVKELSMESIRVDVLRRVKEIVQELPQRHRLSFEDLFKELGEDFLNSKWNDFDTTFLAVHEDFLNRLRLKGPDLSPTEIRICALMRLNLNTKEIASITHRSTGTIDNARSRIRRQLGLSEDRNLYEFLSTL
jgi:tetratricopeptide (TPR) repeat protein